jgi:hypothetical protein
MAMRLLTAGCVMKSALAALENVPCSATAMKDV